MLYRIAAFILCYNESKIISQTINHYKQFCKDIYVLNNESTDDSVKIAESLGCIILNYKSEGVNELQYLKIKQNCYKNYSHLYDYVIVCDADEFLHHKNIFQYLHNNKNIDLFKCIGYEMLYENFDFINNNYKDVLFGSRSANLDKCLLFKSSVNIEYTVGCHHTLNQYFDSDIELRHLKYINIDYVADRYKHLSERMSNINKVNNWGFHYNWEKEKILNYYKMLNDNKTKLEW